MEPTKHPVMIAYDSYIESLRNLIVNNFPDSQEMYDILRDLSSVHAEGHRIIEKNLTPDDPTGVTLRQVEFVDFANAHQSVANILFRDKKCEQIFDWMINNLDPLHYILDYDQINVTAITDDAYQECTLITNKNLIQEAARCYAKWIIFRMEPQPAV